MSRDNLCIGLERDYMSDFPIACELFRKIIDNFEDLTVDDCMRLYDIFRDFCNADTSEQYLTNTFLV